jgi:hypothetical protein
MIGRILTTDDARRFYCRCDGAFLTLRDYTLAAQPIPVEHEDIPPCIEPRRMSIDEATELHLARGFAECWRTPYPKKESR